MIVDCHAHFEPRMLDADAVIRKLDALGIAKVAMIPAMNDPLPETPERLLSIMRKLMRSAPGRLVAERVHRSVLTSHGDLKLAGKVFQIYARPDNEPVAKLCARHPDRFMGWIFLNPRNNPAVLDELERWRAVPGMIGVKVHPHWHDYHSELLFPLLARAEELGLPVLVHLGFRMRGDVSAMCEKFPKLTVISAHAGFPFYDALWKYKRSCPNLYVDLSSPYIDESLARAAVEAMGADRCLYGTDAPYGFHSNDGSYDYGEILRWVERLPISSSERDRMLGARFLELVAR
jgi:uncharacterized protein